MASVFAYQDYRRFLADFYEQKKAADPSFSYQNFSRKAGFASKSFVFNVINGRKNLSRASVVKLCAVLGLGKSEAAYFENLVYFNQAGTVTERAFYYEKLCAIRPTTSEAGSARRLCQDQYEFYANWYHVVIRSLIDLFPQIKDPAELARMVYPAIKPRQARKSIDLLMRLGLINERKGGGYTVSGKILSTGPEVESLAVAKFHLACMELAAKALKELPSQRRNISGLTLGISARAYADVVREIQACQERILAIAEKDTGSDAVYQLNFHLFPVSRTGAQRRDP